MPNIPASDVILDIDKAFVLQRIGTYSSKLKEEIVHTFVPRDDFCVASPKTDICLFTSQTTRTNVLELATILASREMVTALPRYDSDQISSFIGKDLHRIFRIHRPDEFIIKTNSVVHLVNDRFHLTNDIKNSLLDSTKFLVDTNQSDIPRISQRPSSIILRQINNNKIGFDFLTNTELRSFLAAIVSIIDKSYKITDLSESLDLFSQLIVAQSIYVFRSCSINQEHISTSQPCLVVSTLFLRPSIESDNAFSIYRLISLPAIVNGEKFMYSNMPEIIGVNTDVQTVILWNSAPKKNECLFSIFVYCQKEPPLIQLSNSPCLSELLSYDTHVTSSCHVTRSRNIQTGIMNIDNDVWLFSHNEWPLQCHVHSNTGEFGGIISINEPSIVRVPCGNAIKCTNAELPSSACINRSVLIKSSVTGKHEQLSTIPWPIKTMTKQLISTYKFTISNSLKDILDDLKDNRLTVTSVIKEFSALVLSIIFLLLLSFILFFVRWIKRVVQQRIETLEKDVDDVVHQFA
ncbi:unnamed protein product [Didymodactylos carnosus]|uniref:Uncharacterized protein n=1 Tax=Didymodactylos carnosus TaxID=1234261 RepID=A0A8S2JE22_9BILA|nr:unnamed protein product [Didymodactylos carnosus]CAF3805646.1 unnamed protein product [Didymodactylos carnosus]